MKTFDFGSIEGPKSLEAQARRLVAYLDELFFANLQKKHPTEELEGELPAREMRSIVILSNRGRCIMSDFATAIGIPMSTATHMIEKLVRKGLVVRVRSEDDRRVAHVELSDEVLDSSNSIVTQQASNRVWAAQAVISSILTSL